jgi:hypothetical protein
MNTDVKRFVLDPGAHTIDRSLTPLVAIGTESTIENWGVRLRERDFQQLYSIHSTTSTPHSIPSWMKSPPPRHHSHTFETVNPFMMQISPNSVTHKVWDSTPLQLLILSVYTCFIFFAVFFLTLWKIAQARSLGILLICSNCGNVFIPL